MLASRNGASLGASGCLYAIFAMYFLSFINVYRYAYAFPEKSVTFLFFPFISFQMGQILPLVCLIDIVGLLKGWTTFGHAAHLTGAIFGLSYVIWGQPLWRTKLAEKIQEKERG